MPVTSPTYEIYLKIHWVVTFSIEALLEVKRDFEEEMDDFGIRGISWKLEAYTAVIN